tara:strand:- start:174 stop:446 length:273 start_codon:yes stop_codon:yes gene_type:complete
MSKQSTNNKPTTVEKSIEKPQTEDSFSDNNKNSNNTNGSFSGLYNTMDSNNKKAMDVWASKGVDAAVEHMFKHPDTGKPMDYATMRYYYG